MQISVKTLTGKTLTLTVQPSDTIALIIDRLPPLTGVDAAAVDFLARGINTERGGGGGGGNGIVAVDHADNQLLGSTCIGQCLAPDDARPTLCIRIRKRMDDALDGGDMEILHMICGQARIGLGGALEMPTCTRTVGASGSRFEGMVVLGDPMFREGGMNCVGVSYERCPPDDD